MERWLWRHRRTLIALWLVSIIALLPLAGFTNPFRQPSEQLKAEGLIEEFQIDRQSSIPQGQLENLTLFFSNRQLAAIWDAAEAAGGAVTSWEELKGLEGLGETTLWKLYVFFNLTGSPAEER